MIRADWSNVTIGEYRALAILRRGDAIARLNAYWDELHASGRVIAASGGVDHQDVPTRLSADGEAWVAGLQRTVADTRDERTEIQAAGEFLRGMGTLLINNVTRSIA